jgi:hypothetical protein
MQPAEPAQYRAYLLRCWEECEPVSGTRQWRFSLEDTRTGQRRGFASLDELVEALNAGGGSVKDATRATTRRGHHELNTASTPPARNHSNCEHHPID